MIFPEVELYQQANEQFNQQYQQPQIIEVEKEAEVPEKKSEEEELTEEQKERRRIITEAQLQNKKILYSIHKKDLEILKIKREIEDHKLLLQKLKEQQNPNLDNYISHRGLVSYDSYLRGTLREQDRKIYDLELNNAEIVEIQARIEKINKEYEKNIQPLVVGDFKSQIEADIKGSKNQIEALRNQFKEIVDDIVKLHEKHLDNIDMYSTLQRQLQEQRLANEQLNDQLMKKE